MSSNERDSRTTQELAKRIADHLFTNGASQQAQRLVLELPGERDGGGWCRAGVVSAVERILQEREP